MHQYAWITYHGALAAALIGNVGCASSGATTSSDDMTETRAPSASFTAYAQFAGAHGLPVRPDRALVIGIRGRAPDGTMHPTRVGRVFDDKLVILTRQQQAIELAVSTHPWETQSSSAGIPDVDHDGQGDVGMIRPGKYLAVRREASRDIAGLGTYHVLMVDGSDKLPGYRNTDHDDTYSAAERTASVKRGDVLTDVLFHFGGEGAPQVVGCQVLDGDGLRRLIGEGAARFDYLLVDANEEEVPQP